MDIPPLLYTDPGGTGVGTKLGIHITPAAEAYASVEVSVPKDEDLAALVGTLADLMRRSIILNSPSIANVFRTALMSRSPEVHAKLCEHIKPGSRVPDDVLEEMRAREGWGSWKACFSLYGSVETLYGHLLRDAAVMGYLPYRTCWAHGRGGGEAGL